MKILIGTMIQTAQCRGIIIRISTRLAHIISTRRTCTFNAHSSHIIMIIPAFTSRELDVIYDVIFAHLGCTDDDDDVIACSSIIDKMHIFSAMNEEQE